MTEKPITKDEPIDSFRTGSFLAVKALESFRTGPKALTQELIVATMGHFMPFAEPSHHFPRAGFGAGLLLSKYGQHLLAQDDPAAFMAFEKAAKYFGMAACQPDDGFQTPFRAMDTWAWLYEEGLLNNGIKNVADSKQAFALRLDAAHAGFVEAQINLAIMFYRGEGTPPSKDQAFEWLVTAERSKDKLLPPLSNEVSLMRAALEAELNADLSSAPRRGKAPLPFEGLAKLYLEKKFH